MHVHITCADGEAKFWIEPIVSLASYEGLKKRQLKEVQSLVEEHLDEISKAWKKHFSN